MEEENSESFDQRVGQLIRRYRQLRGVSQEKLGHELGISFQQI
jgi:transcriptional regulator with XRE-family HTH domain